MKLSARNLVVKNHPDENLIKIVMITMTMMTLVKPGVVGEVLNISSSRECLTGSCCSLEPGQTQLDALGMTTSMALRMISKMIPSTLQC